MRKMGDDGVATLSGILMVMMMAAAADADWCVSRSSATAEALQTALNYACSSGGDCSPIQPNGLCFLPNNLQAHASYAFNSYYQRRYRATDSCNFAGTATISVVDPSYGMCTYPSSAGSAGVMNTTYIPPRANPFAGMPPPPPLHGSATSAAATPLTTRHLAFPVVAFLLAGLNPLFREIPAS